MARRSDRLGGLDVLVNSADIGKDGLIEDFDEAPWRTLAVPRRKFARCRQLPDDAPIDKRCGSARRRHA